MTKNLMLIIFSVLLLIFTPLFTYTIIMSSVPAVYAVQEKAIYTLPYPGLLPDNPLYFLKIIRDRITEFATRDNLKKAEFYLLTSDKRIAMATALAKKGRDKLAVDTFTKGEKYFFNIPRLVAESKKQGVSAPSGFIDTLKLSNAKHHEVGETLIKDLPQGMNDSLMEALRLNESLKIEIEKL